jgi:hypothetical protein
VGPDNQITLSPIALTMMMCPDSSLDGPFVIALERVGSFADFEGTSSSKRRWTQEHYGCAKPTDPMSTESAEGGAASSPTEPTKTPSPASDNPLAVTVNEFIGKLEALKQQPDAKLDDRLCD